MTRLADINLNSGNKFGKAFVHLGCVTVYGRVCVVC